MAFLPAATAPFQKQWVGEELLVGVFEVTRGEWRAFLEETQRDRSEVWVAKLAQWGNGTDHWPATFMTREESQAFAGRARMRLPTCAEWLLIAAGTAGRLYPWSDVFQDSVANTLDLGLLRPTPVGTFESGRTPQGCCDLLGNAWEWCADALEEGELGPVEKGTALGGSYLYYARPIFSYLTKRYFELPLDPGHRADDLGLRCVAGARAYLWQSAHVWGDDAQSRERLFGIGRRFGPAAVPLLESLADAPDAPLGLRVLLDGARS